MDIKTQINELSASIKSQKATLRVLKTQRREQREQREKKSRGRKPTPTDLKPLPVDYKTLLIAPESISDFLATPAYNKTQRQMLPRSDNIRREYEKILNQFMIGETPHNVNDAVEIYNKVVDKTLLIDTLKVLCLYIKWYMTYIDKNYSELLHNYKAQKAIFEQRPKTT